MDLHPSLWLGQVLPALRSPLGIAAFVPLYALWVTLLLPGVWASMVAGALYGTWAGSFLVFLGACLGAEAAFLLGRTWLRDWARRRLLAFPKLQAIEQGVSREGLKLVLLRSSSLKATCEKRDKRKLASTLRHPENTTSSRMQ